MIVSVNWLKKFAAIDTSIEELAARIGERLVEIESINDLTKKYQDVLIAKVVECAPLQGSDHLNVTKIDDGGVCQTVERDSAGLIQVVCGAPNVKQGMSVAWLPPASIVPASFNDAEPFVLASKTLRGVLSHGMLASASELDLYDDHTGILEVDSDSLPGTLFAEKYELNDYLLDIDNKSLTHRPDAFGIIGFAREVAGVLGVPFTTPDWLLNVDGSVNPASNLAGGLELPSIQIDDGSLSHRFQAIILTNMQESVQSPLLMRTYLARSGIRPLSASVDVSNYMMLLTGQPTHTYDYDKVRAVAGANLTVSVRTAVDGEVCTLLDGKTIELDPGDIVVTAGEKIIGLAGIMGCQNTAVDSTTKTVMFEAATFDLYHLRSSQMRHGIFSEAVTRFTKGIPAQLSTPVIIEAVRLLAEYAGAEAVSAVIDAYPQPQPIITVTTTAKLINETLGTEFASEDIVDLLQMVGFGVKIDDLELTVTVPYWRQDIHIREDITEEVGRISGFDTINPSLPERDFTPVMPSAFDKFRSKIRTILSRAGANEVLTYSFVHGDILKKSGQNVNNSYRIINSISPELQYYRQSLTPSLLSQVSQNVKSGYSRFALYELNKTHQKSDGLTAENVPVESDCLALVVTDTSSAGVAYYQAKYILDYLLANLNVKLIYENVELSNEAKAMASPFDQKLSAQIINPTDGKILGYVGEYKKVVKKDFKLPVYTAGFELDIRRLLESDKLAQTAYQPLSKFPGTERDICFQVATDQRYSEVVEPIKTVLDELKLVVEILPVDIYRPLNSDVKNITVRIAFASYNKTMTNHEIAAITDQIIAAVLQVTGGKVI